MLLVLSCEEVRVQAELVLKALQPPAAQQTATKAKTTAPLLGTQHGMLLLLLSGLWRPSLAAPRVVLPPNQCAFHVRLVYGCLKQGFGMWWQLCSRPRGPAWLPVQMPAVCLTGLTYLSSALVGMRMASPDACVAKPSRKRYRSRPTRRANCILSPGAAHHRHSNTAGQVERPGCWGTGKEGATFMPRCKAPDCLVH